MSVEARILVDEVIGTSDSQLAAARTDDQREFLALEVAEEVAGIDGLDTLAQAGIVAVYGNGDNSRDNLGAEYYRDQAARAVAGLTAVQELLPTDPERLEPVLILRSNSVTCGLVGSNGLVVTNRPSRNDSFPALTGEVSLLLTEGREATSNRPSILPTVQKKPAEGTEGGLRLPLTDGSYRTVNALEVGAANDNWLIIGSRRSSGTWARPSSLHAC